MSLRPKARGLRRCVPVLLLSALLAGCTPGETAQVTDPTATAQGWEGPYEKGLSCLQQELYGQAIDAFTAAIHADPTRAQAYVQRGNAYYLVRLSGEYTNAALNDYNQALSLDPGNAAAWLGLADIDLRNNDFESAVETLETALEYTGQDPQVQDRLDAFRDGDFRDSYKNDHKTSFYDAQGQLVWYATFTYTASDSKGLKRQVCSFDSLDQPLSQVDEVYDEKGRPLVVAFDEDRDGIFWRNELHYDDQGRVLREALYDSQGKPMVKQLYRYDEAGLIIREDRTDYDSGTSSYHTIEYNDHQQPSIRRSYDGDSVPLQSLVYEYDSEHRLSRVSTCSPQDQLLSYQTYSYEDSTTIRRYDGDGTLQSYRVSDDNGITWYQADGTVLDSVTFR